MTDAYREFTDKHVVIMCAPNGARRNHQDHPGLPLSPSELATEARRLVDARVAVLHLHVRDHHGRHSLDPQHYREAINAIEQSVGNELVIQVTTEAAGIYDRHQQMAMVRDLRPRAVSVALRELCPDERAEQEAGEFYAFLKREQIWPQHILYSPGEVQRFADLHRRGLFAEDRPWCLLVLGNYAEQRDGSQQELERHLSAANFDGLAWAVCCFGAWEQQAALHASRLGGHVRLGFENNLLRADGTVARNNAQLVTDFAGAYKGKRAPASACALRAELSRQL